MNVKRKNTLTESSVWSRPAEGKARRGVEPQHTYSTVCRADPWRGRQEEGWCGTPPSQLASPKGVEGGNSLLPALNNQDGALHEDSNKRNGMLNWILITLISIVKLSADQRYIYRRGADWCVKLAKLTGAPIQLHSDARECAHGPEPERAQQEGWRGRHQPGRDMRARLSAGLLSNFEQINLLAGVQAMADQEMS